MKSFKTRHAFFAASLAVALGVFAFACGSNEDVPPVCEGAACVDAGGPESSTAEGSTNDGPGADAPGDAPTEGGDAGACKLEAADADAGPSGTLQWALNFGVSGYTTARAVALDPKDGDIVVVGSLFGSVDFGGGVLVSQAADASASDVFVARFTSAGVYKWAKAFGNGFLASPIGVAVDNSGVVSVGGSFRGASLDFGGGPLARVGSNDLFIVSLDAAGAYRWAKSFGTANNTQILNSVAVDPSGNVLIGGLADALDFGGGARSGFYIAKFTASGTHSWSKAFSVGNPIGNPTLAADQQGNAVLAGAFTGAVDFGAGALASSGGGTAFVAKFDPSGAYQWAKVFAAVPAIPTAIAESRVSSGGLSTDACGNLFLAGDFGASTGETSLSFGGPPLVAPDLAGASNAFLAKLTPAGAGVWSKSFLGTNNNMTTNGRLLMGSAAGGGASGPTISASLLGSNMFGDQESVNFGGGVLTNSGEGSLAVAAFGETGAHRWSYVGGAPSTARRSSPAAAKAVAASASAVVLIGDFGTCPTTCTNSPPGTTLVLAGQTLTATSARDMVLVSFAR